MLSKAIKGQSNSQELKLQEIVSPLMWMLGAKLRCSRKAPSDHKLRCHVFSPKRLNVKLQGVLGARNGGKIVQEVISVRLNKKGNGFRAAKFICSGIVR